MNIPFRFEWIKLCEGGNANLTNLFEKLLGHITIKSCSVLDSLIIFRLILFTNKNSKWVWLLYCKRTSPLFTTKDAKIQSPIRFLLVFRKHFSTHYFNFGTLINTNNTFFSESWQFFLEISWFEVADYQFRLTYESLYTNNWPGLPRYRAKIRTKSIL